MKMTRYFRFYSVILLFSLIVFVGLSIGNRSFGQTQANMNNEAYRSFKKTDLKLNKVYGEILKKYGSDKNFIDKFKLAQRAWLKYRDAHVESLYPEEDKQKKYGTVFPTCSYTAMEKLTANRIEQLKEWSEGVEEGDVCAGSRRFK